MECKSKDLITKQRYTLSELIVIFNEDRSVPWSQIIEHIRILELRLPNGAKTIPLPDDLGDEYKREIHICHNEFDSSMQPMEIAVRSWREGGLLYYEYSTDYEL